MKNKGKFAAVIVVVLTVVAALIYYLYNKEEKTNWQQHFREKSNDPYGTSVVRGLLEKRTATFKEVTTNYLSFIDKEAAKDTNANIVLVNRFAFLSDTEATVLMNWAGKGNTVFFAAESLPGELMRKLYSNQCDQEWKGLESYEDSVVYPNFSFNSLRDSVDYVYKAPYHGPGSFFKTKTTHWNFFDGKYFCETEDSLVKCGYLSTSDDSGYVNFVYIPYGKGGFYLHSNPIMFSNYYLLDYQHLRYTSKTFQHLDDGNIYFDTFHKTYQEYDNNGKVSEGPLVYILSQRSLKYAWYLLLGMTLLYLLFRAKRKQKSIAILEEKKNTTLEYYKTVGSLYFQQRDPYKISLLMFKMFRIYVKDKYKISIKTNDEHTVRLLSTRSHISQEHIERLLTMDRYVNTRPAVSNEDVINYYQKLNYFYLNCK